VLFSRTATAAAVPRPQCCLAFTSHVSDLHFVAVYLMLTRLCGIVHVLNNFLLSDRRWLHWLSQPHIAVRVHQLKVTLHSKMFFFIFGPPLWNTLMYKTAVYTLVKFLCNVFFKGGPEKRILEWTVALRRQKKRKGGVCIFHWASIIESGLIAMRPAFFYNKTGSNLRHKVHCAYM